MAKGKKNFHGRLLCGAAAIALLSWTSAQAQDAKFNIAPQSLDTALREFGVQSGVTIMADAHDTFSKQSRGFSATADPETALKELLAGTGLSYRRSGDVFVVSDASDPQSGSAAGDGADAGTVQALVVTAQKREENIQDVPIAMSAFTQEDLTRSQVAGGPDLMTQVPNFTFTKTNFSGYSIQIRGIGTQAISATTDPAVAVAFNNTPFIRNRFFEQEFYDLERVEVLRGPQGTLYGRNATAGVVNILSAKPKHHFEAKISADVANFNSTRLEGMLNLPIYDDKVALRIAGAWTKRDGFVKNTLTGAQTDGRDLWSARATLGIEPNDSFKAYLIYEHFQENDDRLRSGKQLCHRDEGPDEINGEPVPKVGDIFFPYLYSQGCLPASLYSPDSFQTPNGLALPYGPNAVLIGAPVDPMADPYVSTYQSRNLREIETRLTPEYTASTDTVELQLQFDIAGDLTLASETGYNRDGIFSFQDFNRFNTRRGAIAIQNDAGVWEPTTICTPQLGCSDRLTAGDLSTAKSRQFSQEFRLSSNYDGKLNFSVGANFLRYQTEDKYYVFINTIGQYYDDSAHFEDTFNPDGVRGYAWSDVNGVYDVEQGYQYSDPNGIHSLNDLGRNYFLSRNPYNLLSYAVFGESYLNLSDALKFTLGLRWTVDQKTAPIIPSWLLAKDSYGTPTRKTLHQEWREPTGRVAIDWKPRLTFTDETLVYGSYVHGYKAGGANPPLPIPVFPRRLGCTGGPNGDCRDPGKISAALLTHPETFDAEFVNAYEIGTKNTLLGGRLTANLNAFYYDYTGYQISEIVDRTAINFNFDAKIWGSELEIDWRPSENLRLGLKGGYENTRLADGSSGIDLMDRTAGQPGWVVKKPFPTFTSNCILPIEHAVDPFVGPQAGHNSCEDYHTGYADWAAPNNGEGFSKDLSGNALPNAPKFTATITADYTLPLPSDWLMTLHTDLYYQSEAWTRVFNTPGYDKLKAYNNINVAAIFANEDAGWTVMAYIKNLQNKDSITGAFLNSDDTGLTTNVFLTEPRLYGLRVTKAWNGSGWWSGHANTSGYYPFHIELDGDYSRSSGGREIVVPATVALFPADHPYPLGVQNDLDPGGAGGVKFTFQPQPGGWSVGTAVRYGRSKGDAEAHPKWDPPTGCLLESLCQKYPDQPDKYIMNPAAEGIYNYATTTANNSESHAIADFFLGKDVGLGAAGRIGSSTLTAGLRYAQFKSYSGISMHGRPDFNGDPDNVLKYGVAPHRFHASVAAVRTFEGAGAAAQWDASWNLKTASPESGGVRLETGIGASLLWGKQTVDITGNIHGDQKMTRCLCGVYVISQYNTTLDIQRSKNVVVPGLSANIGLGYTLGNLKLSGGYRVERYFDVIDAGLEERKTFDRQLDGPYFKVAVGFGG